MHIKDDFQSGAPITQVPVSWFNSVAKFLNSIIGGENVTFNKYADGTESVIEVSGSGSLSSDDPENVSSSPDAGSATEIARADHVHALATDGSVSFDSDGQLGVKLKTGGGLSSGDDGLYVSPLGDSDSWVKTDSQGYVSTTDEVPITLPDGAGALYSNGSAVSVKTIGNGSTYDIASGNHTHADYATQSWVTQQGYITSSALSGYATQTWVTQRGYITSAALSGYATQTWVTQQGYLDSSDIDATGGVLSYNANLKTLGNALDSNGKVPLSQLTGNISGHSGNCIVYINNNGALGHMGDGTGGNDIYNAVITLKSTYYDSTNAILMLPKLASKPTYGGKVLTTTANSMALTVSDDTYAKFASAPTGGKFVMTSGTGGTLTEATSMRASAWMKTDASGNPSTTTDTPVLTTGNQSISGALSVGDVISSGYVQSSLTSADGVEGGQFILTAGTGYSSAVGSFNIDTYATTVRFFFEGGTTGTQNIITIDKKSSIATSEVTFGCGVVKLAYAPTDSTATSSTVVPTLGLINANFIRNSKIGVDNGVARYDHTHGSINNDGTLNIGNVPGAFVIFGNSNAITSSATSSSADPALTTTNLAKVFAVFDDDSWASSYGLTISASAIADVDNTNSLCKFNSNGVLDSAVALPTTAPTEDKVLTIKADGTTLSWEPGGGSPSSPGSTVQMNNASSTTDSAYTTVWEYGTSAATDKGVEVQFLTRVIWTGTTLKAYYRTMTFSTKGLLYKISAESATTIDTPTQVTWG